MNNYSYGLIDNNEQNIDLVFKKVDNDFSKFVNSIHEFSDDVVYNHVIHLSHLLIHLFNIARKNGISIDEIRKNIPNLYSHHRASRFVKHIQDWPKGYPGDYQIVNMIIDRNDYQHESGITKFISYYAINSLISQQHREKVIIQSDSVFETCRKFQNPRIASLACGSSRDIEKIKFSISQYNPLIYLSDFENEALTESENRLQEISDFTVFYKTDIRKLPKQLNEFCKVNGKFHLVYAGGLFDYLPEGIIKIIVSQITENCIEKNGCFLFTNIANPNPFKNWIEIFGNWNLIERSKEEILKICSFSNFSTIKIEKDPTELTWIAKCFNE